MDCALQYAKGPPAGRGQSVEIEVLSFLRLAPNHNILDVVCVTVPLFCTCVDDLVCSKISGRKCMTERILPA